MYLHEATKKAMELDKEIYRSSNFVSEDCIFASIKPTNSYDTCILVINENGKKKSCRNWNPTADDLMANDWEVFME